MATLQSPGVQVSVIDESFYTPAAPGTVPLIIVATAQDKANASATGTAQGTTQANAGKVWTITSQRDLTDTFGVPKFYTDASGNPVHGGELNEYGLQAAYSLLGVSSKAYVVRADINLSQLTAQSSTPTGAPVSGTYWLDTGNTLFGINEWDATNSVFVTKTPIVLNDDSASSINSLAPIPSIGTVGSYAIVATSDNQNPLYYKNASGNWVLVGSNSESHFGGAILNSTFASTAWQTSFPVVASTGLSGVTTGSVFVVNGQSVTIGSNVSVTGIATAINAVLPQYHVGAKVNASGKLELYADAGAKSNGTTKDGAIHLADTDAGTLASIGLTTGTYAAVKLTIAPHTQVPQYKTNGQPSGSVYIKTTSQSKGASWVVKSYNGATSNWSISNAPIYASTEAAIKALDSTGGTKIAVNTLFVESNYDHGTGADNTSPAQVNFKVWRRAAVSPTTVTGANDLTSFNVTTAATGTTAVYSFRIAETIAASSTVSSQKTITVLTRGASTVTTTTAVAGSDVVAAINAAGLVNVSATLNSDGTLSIAHALGGDIQLTDSATYPILATLGFTGYNVTTKTGTANLYASGDYDSYTYRATNWKPLVYEAKATTPYTDPADGTLWYDPNFTEVDIMYNNGTTWVGYKTAFPNSDPNGPQVKATQPTTQSDGTELVDGDIWIDSNDSELYGHNVYVWSTDSQKWIQQDVSDQETPNGWVFHDARWATTGQATAPSTIKALLSSDYVDPDCVDPASYPQGTRLWNLRRSGFNIKKYEAAYIDVTANNGKNIRYENEVMDGSGMTLVYNKARWVSVSPNAEDGSGTFGRKAQRSFVVKALKALVDTNQNIRDTDTLVFNLIACPGYTELVANLTGLNTDRANTAFVIGDTPFRLKPTGTALAAWGGNTTSALDNGETGAVTYDEYMGMFYPSGYTTDNAGNSIVVPPSHIMLRTIAQSDQKSYQWFAPAGIRRGSVDNVTAVGYLDNGEFKSTALPTEIRDVLSAPGIKINPIATLNGVGIVNFGNYTRAKGTTSLDRINVSRLVAYLRRQLDILSRPYLFEPNDKNTRSELKNVTESLMLELVGQRALYDYIVVCDESNNSPAQIDRSELHMDIAIEPVKAVEFIYIPLRLKSTGSIKAGNI